MSDVPLRIVQISDTHIFAEEDKSLLGVKTQESFNALINLVKSDGPTPDFILYTGDLSQDASQSSYIRVADELSRFQVPVYCIPGNHDDSQIMQQVYPRGMFSLQKQLVFEGWQFILLDSHIHHKVEGFLSQAELDFMEQCLKQHPNLRAVIVLHHHPVPVGCAWLDKIGVTNAAEFWQVLKRYPQAHTVLFGHVHQQFEGIKEHIKYYSTPSTCIQFKRKSAEFALEELPPGYRVLDFYPNGDVKTNVRRVDHYVGTFEPDAQGY